MREKDNNQSINFSNLTWIDQSNLPGYWIFDGLGFACVEGEAITLLGQLILGRYVVTVKLGLKYK